MVGGASTPPPAGSSAAASACPLGEPIATAPSVAAGRRFGLSDQSGFTDLRDHGGPDTFNDPRARLLDVQRVRIVVPYDLIPRALAQSSATATPCQEYLGVYKWIKNAVEATPQREPLVSFQRRRGGNGRNILPDPREKYRPAVKAFMDQFPAVRVYTAWNEPNHTTQPTRGTNRELRESHAWTAGRYWRHMNQLCQRGRRCVVAAGDFLDTKTLHERYRSQYWKGMGSPGKVAVWAYHPYGAIKYGRTRSPARRFARFLDSTLTRGSRIWLTESGAYARQDPGATSQENLNKQRDDLDDFLNDPGSGFQNSKVRRFYYYEWWGVAGFDTALTGYGHSPAGDPGHSGANAPTRPVYCTLLVRTNPSGPPCPP